MRKDSTSFSLRIRSTTVVAVVRNGRIAIAADGQVSLGDMVMKQRAEKRRRVGKGRALAGARALIRHTNMEAREIAEEALRIASEICIYTNANICVETLP